MYIDPSGPNARSSGDWTGPSPGTTTSTSPVVRSTALIRPARNWATCRRPSGPNATPLEPHRGFGLVSRRTVRVALTGVASP
jgi:hypothetical protein